MHPLLLRTAAAARGLCVAHDHCGWPRFLGLAVAVAVVGALGADPTWASVALHIRTWTPASAPLSLTARAVQAAAAAAHPAPAFAGADIDGDGRPDFANPTGHAARTHDAYGYGAFGVSRDGGERRHEGVDYVSRAGQAVKAPMSGYVTRIGYAYSDDQSLRTVEIVNPALNYVARLLYVSPVVQVGQAVAVGVVVGYAQNLQARYPRGMTNHVHLQIARRNGAWLDCQRLVPGARG